MDVDISDEDYVIHRAKIDLEKNPLSAKAWMITAKTLYPNNFGVQFEAYLIEKNAGNIKEAAKCFSELISKFQQREDLWKEIEKVTEALRAESDTNDPEKQFLCNMFRHISSDVQHQLLLFTADHCEDTMDHCRLLLLLLQRFPTAISSYGPRLLETLLSAEKHRVDGHLPVNCFRKLLVGDLLPLLATQEAQVDLPSKMLYKLLYKSMEFYLCSLGLSTSAPQDSDMKEDDLWQKLFAVLEFIGTKLKWEPYLLEFKVNWSKETYWQSLVGFCQAKSSNLDDKQLLYCLTVFFVHCLYEYNVSLTPEASPGQVQTVFVLTEAFVDKDLPSPATDPKTKKRKMDEILYPYISVEKPELKNIQSNFVTCVNCWDLLHSSDVLKREFGKLKNNLKLQPSISAFLIDYAIYKGQYEEALMCLQQIKEPNLMLNRYIRIASIYYLQQDYHASFEAILLAIPLLPSYPGSLSTTLIVGGNQRHLHYLPIARLSVLQYFIKILIRAVNSSMEKSSTFNDLAIGHIFTLTQLDWPQEDEFIQPLLTKIVENYSFQYHLFANYIVNVDLLEEFMHFWRQGVRPQVQLDLLPHLGQRRIGTRGADKGAKEEIKQAIRRQIARSNESVDELLVKFITQERSQILQVLVPK